MDKFFLKASVLIFLFNTAGLPAQTSFSAFIPAGSSRLTLEQVESLLSLSETKSWNVFDLLNELTADLQKRRLRIELTGDTLRLAARTYRLGDHRVFAILPIEKVRNIQVGYTDNPQTLPSLEIRLTQPHSDYLELGDFSLETYYGFRVNGPKALDQAFGALVKNGPLTFNLEKIERVPDPTGGGSPNFIAIHVQLFFRPKRWHIDPVRHWTPEEAAKLPSR